MLSMCAWKSLVGENQSVGTLSRAMYGFSEVVARASGVALERSPPGISSSEAVRSPEPPQDGTAAFTRLSMPVSWVVRRPPIEWP